MAVPQENELGLFYPVALKGFQGLAYLFIRKDDWVTELPGKAILAGDGLQLSCPPHCQFETRATCDHTVVGKKAGGTVPHRLDGHFGQFDGAEGVVSCTTYISPSKGRDHIVACWDWLS